MKACRAAALVVILLSACATHQADHFYVIDSQPGAPRASNQPFTRQVTLRESVPALVDRAQMVTTTADGVAVAEHERWAAPLSDLISSTLARDIEQRRGDVLVLPHRMDQPGAPRTEIAVEVNEVRAVLGRQVSLEAHWRVAEAGGGKVSLGRDVFVSNLHSGSYAALADGLSASLALLADRLVQDIPAP